MKRLWPFALLLLPALSLLGRVERTAGRPRIIRHPVASPPAAPEETLAQLLDRHFPEGAALNAPAIPGAVESGDSDQNDAALAPQENRQAWKRSAIQSAVVWFAHHQNEDGSFGDGPATLEGRTIGRTGITALALLAFLGYGYSPLSKDELDGMHIGGMVKRAVTWLLADQREDGSFRSAQDIGFDQVLAALALSECYGMTASATLQAPTAVALDAMARMQGSDGSWGGAAPTAWALVALKSAELSELPVPGAVRERALAYPEMSSHPSDLWNRLVLGKNREGAAERAALLAAAPPAADDFAAWYHTAGSLERFDGPEGPVWNSARERMKQALLSQHSPGEPWFGSSVGQTVVQSSLAMLSLELLWNSSPPVFTAAR